MRQQLAQGHRAVEGVLGPEVGQVAADGRIEIQRSALDELQHPEVRE